MNKITDKHIRFFAEVIDFFKFGPRTRNDIFSGHELFRFVNELTKEQQELIEDINILLKTSYISNWLHDSDSDFDLFNHKYDLGIDSEDI